MGGRTRAGPAPPRDAGPAFNLRTQFFAYDVQPAHHFVPPGAAAPRYAVPSTAVPAAVAMLPVKVVRPPLAASDPAGGVQSNEAGAVAGMVKVENRLAVVADPSRTMLRVTESVRTNPPDAVVKI